MRWLYAFGSSLGYHRQSELIALWASVLAADTTGQQIPLTLIGSAISGLGVIVSGKVLVPTFVYTRERDGHDATRLDLKKTVEEKDAEIRRLNTLLQENTQKTLPALEAATAVQFKSQEALATANQIIRDLTHQLGSPGGPA